MKEPVFMQAGSKADIRRELVYRRRALSPEQVRDLSRGIIDRLLTLAVWSAARRVLLYLPINNEVDTGPLLRMIWERGKTAMLPCCRPNEPGVMDFFEVRHEGQLKPGYCSIPEPDRSCCTLVQPCIPDLAVIPGVGFDRSGYRLGYGGGYYDRFLADRVSGQTLVAGLGYDLQIVDALPRDPWDMPMDLIITEKEIIRGATP